MTMKRSKINFFLVAALLMTIGAQAQQGTWKLDAAYKAALPLGNFKNSVTDKASYRGWSGAILYGVNDKLSVGVETGFQDFYQRYPRQVYHDAGSDLSAVVTNSVQVIPLLLKGKYQWTESATVQPYASLGLGAGLVQYRKFYGEFSDTKSSISFAAQPELGIAVPLGKARTAAFQLGVGYQYLPFKYNEVKGINNAMLKAGFTIPLHQ